MLVLEVLKVWFAKRRCITISMAFLAFAGCAHAEADDGEVCTALSPGCIAVGEWQVTLGLGLGLRSNPLIDGEDIPLFILPEIQYYGERFFFDTYTGGFTFFDSGSHMLNGVVTIGFDQIYFKTHSIGNIVIESGPFSVQSENASDAADAYVANSELQPTPAPQAPAVDLEQLHDRNTAGLAGLEYGYYSRHWDISLQLLQDFTSVHRGREARAGISRYLKINKEYFELAGGFSWQSADLLSYYYGIEQTEVQNADSAYSPSDGISPFMRVDWRRKISGNWSWQATVHYRWLSAEIRHSPLVGENDVLTFYMGGVYHF